MKITTLLFCTECSDTQLAIPSLIDLRKPLYDITFTCSFLSSNQMTTCEQINICYGVVDCFIDLGLHRIHCCMVLHHSELMVSVGNNESHIVVYPPMQGCI